MRTKFKIAHLVKLSFNKIFFVRSKGKRESTIRRKEYAIPMTQNAFQ